MRLTVWREGQVDKWEVTTEQPGPKAIMELCSEYLSLLFSKTNPNISHSAVKNLAAQVSFLRTSLAQHCDLGRSVLTLPSLGDKTQAHEGGIIDPVSQSGR